MTYNINTEIFSNTYSVPTVVADKYLKIATLTQLKVLLYFMRNLSDSIDSQKIAAALSLPISEVEDALLFWAEREILKSEEKLITEEPKKSIIISADMPSRADVIGRGLEDERITFLLREAQMKFGRNLKGNESSTLVALYDDFGMDISVILLLLQYAARENKCNLSFIRSTATAWLNAGVETVMDAEKLIADNAKQKLAWSIVEKTFGIEKRKPSAKELELSNLWINEWHITTDMLKSAYDVCVDTKTKLSIPYIAKILENWHKDGIISPEQIPAKTSPQKQPQKSSFAGYDLDLFEKMLNKDD